MWHGHKLWGRDEHGRLSPVMMRWYVAMVSLRFWTVAVVTIIMTLEHWSAANAL
jgi:hypothetical protein